MKKKFKPIPIFPEKNVPEGKIAGGSTVRGPYSTSDTGPEISSPII
jgi:hypothetical protein